MERIRAAKCVVSGSFTKFKPSIDEVIAIFKSSGIVVLSPAEGSLYKPQNELWLPGSYPLKKELHLSETDAKLIHIDSIKRTDCDFIYFVNTNNPNRLSESPGYIGKSALEEFLTAYSHIKNIYASAPFDPALDDYEPIWLNMIQVIQIKSPREVADLFKDGPLEKSRIFAALSTSTVNENLESIGFIDHTLQYRKYFYGLEPLPEKTSELS